MIYKHKNRGRLNVDYSIVMDMKNHKIKGLKKGLNLTFK